MNNKRNSSIELLRIISMALIVFHHFNVHGIYKMFIKNLSSINYLDIPTTNHLISAFLSSGGKIGVDVFMIISGYFMINSKFRKNKFYAILLQMWFYSILFFTINMFTHWTAITPHLILISFFPFLYNGYWFITAYLILYLFSPFINQFLKSLNKKTFQKLIFLIIILVFTIPTILPDAMHLLDNGIIITGSCYIIGAYLRLYSIHLKRYSNKQIGMFFTILSIFILSLSFILIEFIGRTLNQNNILQHINFFTGSNSLFVLCLSIGLFIIFNNHRPFYNKSINTISSTTLGIYLIHENTLARFGLWKHIVNPTALINYPSIQFFIFSILIPIVIFFTCFGIEYLRIIVFKKIKHIISLTPKFK